MQYGWIKLHRQITEHWLWEEKPFSKGQAWIDLLLQANHKENKVPFGNQLISIERGEFLTSESKLAERWGWSRKKVRNFLTMLSQDGMIENIKMPNKGTRIKIVNYKVYQDLGDNTGTTKDTTQEQLKNNRGTTEEQLRNTNKNDKNDKNDKNKKIYIQYAEFVKMTEEEYNKLVAKYGEKKVKRMIEVLDNYKGATGKKYKSDYRAILNWVADKVLKEKDDDDEREITDEEMKILIEKRQQLEEEKKKRMEEFNKLPKEEQERYINIAKNFIANNNKQRGIYLISDYLKEGAK